MNPTHQIKPEHRVVLDVAGKIEAKRITDTDRLIAISVWLDSQGVGYSMTFATMPEEDYLTLEHGVDGSRKARIGDWVIRSGSFFAACSDATFNLFYEPIEEA